MNELTMAWTAVIILVLLILGIVVVWKRRKGSRMSPEQSANMFFRMGLIFTVIGAVYSLIEIFALKRAEPLWDNTLLDLGLLYLIIGLVWMYMNKRRAGSASGKTSSKAGSKPRKPAGKKSK